MNILHLPINIFLFEIRKKSIAQTFKTKRFISNVIQINVWHCRVHLVITLERRVYDFNSSLYPKKSSLQDNSS